MKKIGQGLSYTVYELPNNRVLKKPTFNFYKFSKLLLWSVRYRFNLSLVKKLSPIISSGKESIDVLRENIDKIDSKVIGNPVFCDSLEYTQDKVEILDIYFKSHSHDENKKIVDNYIQNTFETWQNGFSDIDFNFAMNSGVTNAGFVVLADINGLCFDKNELAELIKKQVWLNKHSFTHLVDEDLKKYFKDEMDKHLTLSNLELYWENLIK
jgi:hypothetical protein